MKLIKPMDETYIREEAEGFRSPTRSFLPRQNTAGFFPAWSFDGTFFQLTLHSHAKPSSEIQAFASGRVKVTHGLRDGVGIIEIIGVLPPARGKQLGIKMHEFIMRQTGLPLLAAHVQTPMGRDLWLRSLQHMKRAHFEVVDPAGRLYPVNSADDIAALPFDLYNGSEASIMVTKLARGPVAADPAVEVAGVIRH